MRRAPRIARAEELRAPRNCAPRIARRTARFSAFFRAFSAAASSSLSCASGAAASPTFSTESSRAPDSRRTYTFSSGASTSSSPPIDLDDAYPASGTGGGAGSSDSSSET